MMFGSLGALAIAPIEPTVCLSKTGLKVMPPLVVGPTERQRRWRRTEVELVVSAGRGAGVPAWVTRAGADWRCAWALDAATTSAPANTGRRCNILAVLEGGTPEFARRLPGSASGGLRLDGDLLGHPQRRVRLSGLRVGNEAEQHVGARREARRDAPVPAFRDARRAAQHLDRRWSGLTGVHPDDRLHERLVRQQLGDHRFVRLRRAILEADGATPSLDRARHLETVVIERHRDVGRRLGGRG